MNILVIDGQGGGIGRTLIEKLLEKVPTARITCVGTNAMATANMLKAGAHEGATGENAVIVCVKNADVVLGPIGIVIADAMLGELTPKIAAAVGACAALKILIPISRCNTTIAGMPKGTPAQFIEDAIQKVLEIDD